MIKEKKINLNLVVIYYTQINLFLYIQFPIKVADVDIQVEMGRSGYYSRSQYILQ